jgi:hypothetical protein
MSFCFGAMIVFKGMIKGNAETDSDLRWTCQVFYPFFTLHDPFAYGLIAGDDVVVVKNGAWMAYVSLF